MKADERTAWTKGFEKGMIAGRAINEGAASVKLAAAQAVVKREIIAEPTDDFLRGFQAGILRIADALEMTDRVDGFADLIAFTRTAVEAEMEKLRGLCEHVHFRAAGDHLLSSIKDDEMISVHLSAGFLRGLATTMAEGGGSDDILRECDGI